MRRVRFGRYKPTGPLPQPPKPCIVLPVESTCAPRPEGYVTPPMDIAALRLHYRLPAEPQPIRPRRPWRQPRSPPRAPSPLPTPPDLMSFPADAEPWNAVEPPPVVCPAGGRRPPVVPGTRRIDMPRPRRIRFENVPTRYSPERSPPQLFHDVCPAEPSLIDQGGVQSPDPCLRAQQLPGGANILDYEFAADNDYCANEDNDLIGLRTPPPSPAPVRGPETPVFPARPLYGVYPHERRVRRRLFSEVPDYFDPFGPIPSNAVPYQFPLPADRQRIPRRARCTEEIMAEVPPNPVQYRLPVHPPIPPPMPAPYVSPQRMPYRQCAQPSMINTMTNWKSVLHNVNQSNLIPWIQKHYPGGRDPLEMVPPPQIFQGPSPRPSGYVTPPPTPDPNSLYGWMLQNYPGGGDPFAVGPPTYGPPRRPATYMSPQSSSPSMPAACVSPPMGPHERPATYVSPPASPPQRPAAASCPLRRSAAASCPLRRPAGTSKPRPSAADRRAKLQAFMAAQRARKGEGEC